MRMHQRVLIPALAAVALICPAASSASPLVSPTAPSALGRDGRGGGLVTPSPLASSPTPSPPASSPTPAPVVAKAQPGSRRARLAWRPPALVRPITVTLCNCNLSDDDIIVNLRVGQDYILKAPVVLTHPVVIQGGHNIVWIGGVVRPTAGPDIGIQLIRNVGYGRGTIHPRVLDRARVLSARLAPAEWAS